MTPLNDSLQVGFYLPAAVPQPETFQYLLTRRAREVFESDEKAEVWLNWQIPALGYRKPIELAQTKQGFEEAETVLVQIEYGSY